MPSSKCTGATHAAHRTVLRMTRKRRRVARCRAAADARWRAHGSADDVRPRSTANLRNVGARPARNSVNISYCSDSSARTPGRQRECTETRPPLLRWAPTSNAAPSLSTAPRHRTTRNPFLTAVTIVCRWRERQARRGCRAVARMRHLGTAKYRFGATLRTLVLQILRTPLVWAKFCAPSSISFSFANLSLINTGIKYIVWTGHSARAVDYHVGCVAVGYSKRTTDPLSIQSSQSGSTLIITHSLDCKCA
jgi:hypothetical protein